MDNTINMENLPFKEQKKILDRISDKMMFYESIKGAMITKDEVRQYCNNWQLATKEGYELRSRQIRELLSLLKFKLIEGGNSLKPIEIELLNKEIRAFELISERINIRLEKYKNLPEKPLKSHRKPPDVKTYQWQNNPDKELPEFYSLMIDKYKLIASDTTLEQFKDIFTGQPIEIINPITWHQDNASELLYFIIRLGQSGNIEYNPKKADYKKMTACFVKPDGKPFNSIWKSLKTNLEITLSQAKRNVIDELVNNF
jgi:hypothetical protein